MKHTSKLILAAALSAALIASASCGEKKGGASDNSAAESNPAAESTTTAAITEATGEDTSDTAAAEPIDPKTVDYSHIDYTIEYGDSETINKIASDMWWGSYDGKVVKVDGIAEILGSWSIMEDTGEGSKVGFSWELVGSDDYPMDGSRVELIGVIAPGGKMEGQRILHVLPENMTVKSLSADESSASAPKKGVWLAKSGDPQNECYFYFNDEGGSILYQDTGTGVPFGYEVNEGEIMFHIAAADDNTPMIYSQISEDSITLEDTSVGIKYELTFITEDSDNFTFFCNEYLTELAKAFYAGNNDGHVPERAEAVTQEDGLIAVSIFTAVDDNIAAEITYTVDRYTAKGTDDKGNDVDLSMAAGSVEDMRAFGSQGAAGDAFMKQREEMKTDGSFFGVWYLGYIQPESNDPSIDASYISHILDHTGAAEACDITINMPYDKFVFTVTGSEFYLVIPPAGSTTVEVYTASLTGEATLAKGEKIYQSDCSPFLLKCNVSEIVPDVVVVISSDGQQTEWSPGISGNDGTVVTSNSANLKIHDFTDYSRLATTDMGPVG